MLYLARRVVFANYRRIDHRRVISCSLLRAHCNNNTQLPRPIMASHAPDIITLDNLSQTLTPWNPQGESQLYAIVDMGRYMQLAFLSIEHLI